MVFRFDRYILFVHDIPTVRMVYFLADWKIDELLLDAIVEWSYSKPIRLSNIAQLKWQYAKKIVDYYTSITQEITNDSFAISNLIRSVILYNSSPLPDNPIMLKYGERFRVCFPCVDNEANLIILPSGSNVETMRFDDFVIIEAIINAKAEYIKQEQSKLRR